MRTNSLLIKKLICVFFGILMIAIVIMQGVNAENKNLGITLMQNDSIASKIIPCAQLINIHIQKVCWNGYILFNVTNLGNQTIENATIYIHIQGGAHYHGYVDVNTSILITNLPCIPEKNWQLYQTKDQIFLRKQYPIFHRPLLGKILIKEKFGNSVQLEDALIIFAILIDHIT
jgi:hypothetical protein